MTYIDTNVFIRYLTGDDPTKGEASTALMEKVESGEVEVTTCEAIVAEIVFVLSSRSQYGLSPQVIRDKVAPILTLKGLKLKNKKLYLEALDIYAAYKGLDYEDALCVADMKQKGIGSIFSYDTDFDQIPQIERQEPRKK
jgi:uncharacterized protein